MSISRKDCINALQSAGYSEVDAMQTVDEMLRKKSRLEADGRLSRGEADLAAATTADFDAARAEHANKRRQAALTIIRRADVDRFIADAKAAGFSSLDALEARLVGSSKRMPGARQSVDARRGGIEAGYQGRLLNGMDAIAQKHGLSVNALMKMVGQDGKFELDFATERMKPGSVDSALIKDVVELYDALSEDMRQRLIGAGANIGQLSGRLPQSHDQLKLLDAKLGGRQGWVSFVEGVIDAERSFPGKSQEQVREILESVYNTIVTGRDMGSMGGDVPAMLTPRNIASGLGQHRVLHFKSGEAAISYRKRYGRGNLFDSIWGEIEVNSRKLALMEVLGPNPEHMIRSILDTEKQSIREAVQSGAIDETTAKKQMSALEHAYSSGGSPTGKVARWMAVLNGETQMPVNVGLAKAFGIARAFQSFSKLGAAALSTVADGFTKATALRVNGVGFLERSTAPFLDYFTSYQGDKRVLARELGFLIRDVHGSMLHRFDQADTVPGRVSSAMNSFFKWTGMTYATERQKAGFAMRISNHLGMAQGLDFPSLNPDLRAMLEYHGFTSEHWDVFRKHMVEGVADNRYFNPGLARNLTDKQIAHLLPERLQGEPRQGISPELWAEAQAREIERIRVDLETSAKAFFADETKYAVIEPDAKTTAVMSWGTRPGTPEGEALRTLMQFKSFPIAFWQRIIGGRRWKRGSVTGFDLPGIIEYTVSSLAYGYLAMSLKDISKNRTPKDPRKLETWFAAAMQSGGAGIYGDFFLGKANRFGGDFLDTLAGPALGEAGALVNIGQLALHGEPERAMDQGIRFAMNNAPFINLWYTRAAMDYLLLDDIKEWMSPGYKRRMRKNLEKDYGQRQLVGGGPGG